MDADARTELEARVRTALREGRHADAVTLAVQGYGPEILGFLIASSRSEADGVDVFSQFCEDLWRGVGDFRAESSFRTWAYTLARNASHRFRRDPYRRRGVALSECPGLEHVAVGVQNSTLSFLRSEVRDGVARLREHLDTDDQMLLVLRVDRQMSWTDIAAVFASDVGADGDRKRHAATLRKRFERVKVRLRDLATREGLFPPGTGRSG